jgi:phenylacetate-CoA ligase
LNQVFLFISTHNHPLTEYYRTRGLGIKPIFLETLEELRQIPTLDKSVLKEWLLEGRLYKSAPSGSIYSHTSGSTGSPFMTAVDPETAHVRSLIEANFQRIAGVRHGMRELRIWRTKALTPEMIALVANQKLLFVFIDAHDFSSLTESEQMERLFETLARFKPDIIKGYAGVISKLAAYAQNTGKPVHKPKVVLPVGEYLSKSEWRRSEEIFQCPVVNLYGGTETPAVAMSDSSDHPFIIAKNLYIAEVESPGTPTEFTGHGALILTDLNNCAMPLIRYRNGDLCTLPAANQTSFDVSNVSEFVGRSNDILTLPDGSTISPHLWFVQFREFHWIDGFLIVQNEIGNVTVEFYSHATAPSTALQQVESAARILCSRYLTSVRQINRPKSTGNAKRKVISSCYRHIPGSESRN